MKVKSEKPLADFGVRVVSSKGIRGVKLESTRRKPSRSPRRAATMTEADWDKFERDIAEVFEQVP